jgi:hypothetical protein
MFCILCSGCFVHFQLCTPGFDSLPEHSCMVLLPGPPCLHTLSGSLVCTPCLNPLPGTFAWIPLDPLAWAPCLNSLPEASGWTPRLDPLPEPPTWTPCLDPPAWTFIERNEYNTREVLPVPSTPMYIYIYIHANSYRALFYNSAHV